MSCSYNMKRGIRHVSTLLQDDLGCGRLPDLLPWNGHLCRTLRDPFLAGHTFPKGHERIGLMLDGGPQPDS
eukprot:5422273-Amphidinium_carterae.1